MTISISYSQQNFNLHFSIENSNLTPGDLVSWNNYLIASYLNADINGNGRSGIAFYKLQDKSFSWEHFQNFRIGNDGMSEINNSLYLFGKDFDSQRNLSLIKYDLFSNNVIAKSNYESKLDYNFPFRGQELNNVLVRGYLDNSDSVLHREFGLLKLDTTGQLIFQKNYNQHFTQSTLGGIVILGQEISSDIYVASKIQDNSLDYGQILRIDSAGTVIDSVDSEEQFLNFQSRVFVVKSDPNTLVSAYEVDRVSSRPFRFEFYNMFLELKSQMFLPSTESNRVSIVKLVEGRGNYFYVLGSFTDFDDELQFGLVLKMSSSGEVLWTRKYQHPDFMDINIIYSVVDMFESENGDLTFLGNIFPLISPQEMWLFKTNSNGCFLDENCDEEVLYTSNSDISVESDLLVYPNPVEDILFITSEKEKINHLEIFDLRGSLVVKQLIKSSSASINLAGIISGCYAAKVYFENGTVSKKLIYKE